MKTKYFLKELWRLAKRFITEWLLLTFALLTALNFTAIWINPQHTAFIGETNIPILVGETILILFAIGWGIRITYSKFRGLGKEQ